ncbi:hypothetical protein [Halomonas sp. M4R1S46]|uniref:hypothetical protein n=1 Tax=Halomonas sp. M4R1S46 TaxID=2982692 RepID=UPI0021E4C10C|nr:hypothetical protein [Halomonas sp. M4R1S46]UYG08886.1 hypothetical protein OCT48_06025 [Halomonas sp. M4R1S46]
MATLTADIRATARRPMERRPTRWWLAGLLVGCLLPAGLAQLESSRPVERVIQICILAPALIRASSRLQARRRAHRRWPGPRLPVMAARPGRPVLGRCVPRRAVAAHDVLSRRGPPSARRG